MARQLVLPLQDYADGFYEFGPVNIGDEIVSILFEVSRCTSADPTIWPDVNTTLRFVPELSLDGGTTWSDAGEFRAVGGIANDRFGNELAVTVGGGLLLSGTNRRMRGTLEITGGPLRSTGTVIVE